MNKQQIRKRDYSRRKFIGTTAAAAAAVTIVPWTYGCRGTTQSAETSTFSSTINGVQVGTITYSFRSMPSSAEEVLQYCVDAGISTVELMGNVAEAYAGLPEGPPRPERGVELTEEQQAEYDQAREAATEAQRQWRISAPMTKFEELRTMYNDAGVDIHIAKFSPANWTDEEIDYSFNAARALGALGVCNEIGEEACTRLAPFAEKHNMYAIFHQHGQPGEPGWSFDPFLEISPAIMLNLDVGHYFGATGENPTQILERLHDRIVSIHVKDKTGPSSEPPNTNMPWGQGETPLGDILTLIRDQNWPIYCDIELEYEVPEGSNAVTEVGKCLDYARNLLEA